MVLEGLKWTSKTHECPQIERLQLIFDLFWTTKPMKLKIFETTISQKIAKNHEEISMKKPK